MYLDINYDEEWLMIQLSRRWKMQEKCKKNASGLDIELTDRNNCCCWNVRALNTIVYNLPFSGQTFHMLAHFCVLIDCASLTRWSCLSGKWTFFSHPRWSMMLLNRLSQNLFVSVMNRFETVSFLSLSELVRPLERFIAWTNQPNRNSTSTREIHDMVRI